MTKIDDFAINISEAKLKDLKKRLELTRWPDKETPKDWTQGIPLSYMKDIHSYWLNEYDWKKQEEKLNEFPHFMTKINDLDISEKFILWSLALPVLFFGFYPEPLINTIEVSVNNVIEMYNSNVEIYLAKNN